MIDFSFSGTEPLTTAKSLAKNFLEKTKDFEFSGFGVGFSGRQKEAAKKEILPGLVKEIESLGGKKFSNSEHEVFLLADLDRQKASVEIKPVFVFGRYNKFSREVAQTIHFCTGCRGRGCKACGFTGKKTKDSVEEIIGKKAAGFFGAKQFLFHGAGREDVDVRMLGSGRKFVLELTEPKKRSIDLKELEKVANSDKRTKFVLESMTDAKSVKNTKAEKNDKVYLALAECSLPVEGKRLSALVGMKLQVGQMTPARVEKRRAMLERKRHAEILSLEVAGKKSFRIRILAESGLYIKEFISGDRERTKPSISSLLGNACVCAELDVLEIPERKKL